MTTLSQLAQLQLELINRARMDPLGEVARTPGMTSLNQFIQASSAGFPITADPKQVLAGNNQLTTAAVGHSNQMAATGSLSHSGIGDFDPATRINNAGYTGNNVLRNENIGFATYNAFNSNPAALPTQQQLAQQLSEAVHTGLFYDDPAKTFGEDGGHRLAMLDPSYKEIGIGVTFQFTGTANSVDGRLYLTENFGNRGTQSFLTGAVYNDTNQDNFYGLGEAVSGVTVTVRNTSGAVIGSDITGDGGGWSVGQPGGTYKVTFSAAGRADVAATIEAGSLNAKMDLVNGNEIYANANTTLNEGAVGLRLIGIQNINGTGNALANRITGNAGANILTGAGGNDTIDGRGGSDTVVFSGRQSDYKIIVNGNTATLEDLRAGSPDGLDTITNIEAVRFSDITVAYGSLTNQIPVANRAPTVAVADKTLAANAVAQLGPWVSYSDPENNPATQYQIVDNGTAGSSAVLLAPNGTVVAAGTTLTVSAADLANVSIRGGSAAGTESFQIRAFDGTSWSDWDLFNITTAAPAVNQAPVATIDDRSLNVNQWVKVSDLLTYSDAEGNPAVQYQFIDLFSAGGSAYFWNNGTLPTANQVFTVNAAELANLWIRGAQVGGWDNMQVRAFDGTSWGAWDTFKITTLPNKAPVATINDRIVRPNSSTDVTKILKYADADGDAAVRYQFIDLYNGAGSAHFLNDGQVVAANQAFTVNAADLSKVVVRGAAGSGWDNMQVRAYDGKEWGAWKTFKITTNEAPVALIDNKSVSKNEWVQVSTLVKTTDAEGDAITEYQFIDKFDAAGSAYFWFNGQKAANQTFTVKAADLANVWVRGGTGPGWDKMLVRANDGNGWGAWDAFKFTTLDNSLPVVSASDINLRIGQKVAASSLFSVTDPDAGDVITKYQFFDDTALANSGRFALGNNILAADTTHTVSADNLSRLTFTAGSAAGTDLLWVRAFDGDGWSAWHQFNANTIV